MKFLLILCGFLISFQCLSAPLIYEGEISIKVSDIDCLAIKCVKDSKVSVNIISGGVGDVQTSVIAKLSGKAGAIGGQAFIRLNKYVWVGADVTSDIKLNFENNIYFSGELEWKALNLFPYASLQLKKEKISSVGVKLYAFKNISLGVEYNFNDDQEPIKNATFLVGVRIDKKNLKRFEDLISNSINGIKNLGSE